MSKMRFFIFFSSHSMTNVYPYHKRRLSNFDGRYHYLLDSHIYDTTSIDDNICSDDDYFKKDMIIR
jgi:hypothetical protein